MPEEFNFSTPSIERTPQTTFGRSQPIKMATGFDKVFMPKGYTRKETIGRAGLERSGQINAYYYDPTGKCIKTKYELQKSLGNRLDLSILDFKTGKISQFLVQKSQNKMRTIQMQQIRQPHRQKQVLIKQAVRCLKTQPTSRVNHSIEKLETDPIPRQLFWEKRLNGYKVDKQDGRSTLPKNIKPCGPEMNSSSALLGMAAALQTGRVVFGQNDAQVLGKNPCVLTNPTQPLVYPLVIKDEDIRRQEALVLKARRQLEAAFKNNELNA